MKNLFIIFVYTLFFGAFVSPASFANEILPMQDTLTAVQTVSYRIDGVENFRTFPMAFGLYGGYILLCDDKDIKVEDQVTFLIGIRSFISSSFQPPPQATLLMQEGVSHQNMPTTLTESLPKNIASSPMPVENCKQWQKLLTSASPDHPLTLRIKSPSDFQIQDKGIGHNDHELKLL